VEVTGRDARSRKQKPLAPYPYIKIRRAAGYNFGRYPVTYREGYTSCPGYRTSVLLDEVVLPGRATSLNGNRFLKEYYSTGSLPVMKLKGWQGPNIAQRWMEWFRWRK
jgi:hypothetical protein